jgi:hypothetical protein
VLLSDSGNRKPAHRSDAVNRMPGLVPQALQESIASMAVPDASQLNVVAKIHGVRPGRAFRPTSPTRSTAFLQPLRPVPSPLHLCLPLDTTASKRLDCRSVFSRNRAIWGFSAPFFSSLSPTCRDPKASLRTKTYYHVYASLCHRALSLLSLSLHLVGTAADPQAGLSVFSKVYHVMLYM